MYADYERKKFFIKLHIADVNPDTLSKHKQQVRKTLIFEQNVWLENQYKNKVSLENIQYSRLENNHLFSPYMSMLTDFDKFKSKVKKEITLLEAIEFLGLGWIPTDEYGELFQDDIERCYQTDPYSEKGQQQIHALHKGIKRLEWLLNRGVHIKLGTDVTTDTNVVEPNIILGADNTFATITCVEPKLKSYKDAIIDFDDLRRALEEAKNLRCMNTYQVSMELHGLYLQKNNGFKKKIHGFSWKMGKEMPDTQKVLQYVMLRENIDVSIEEIHAQDLILKETFGNGLKSVFEKNMLMRKIKQYFFPGATKTIRFISTRCDIDESEFDFFE